MRLINSILVVCLLASVGRATSIIFPTFSTPIFKEGVLVFLSHDRKRLVAFDTKGVKRWDRKLDQASSLAERPDGKLWLLSEATAATLDLADGSIYPQFTVPGVNWLRYAEEADVLFGARKSADFQEQMGLKVFTAATGTPLCAAKQGETIAYADSDVIVIASSERKNVDRGYSYARGWLEAFDRSTGAGAWTTELTGRPDPYHAVARVGHWLVFEDATEWLLVNLRDGTAQRRPVEKPADSNGPSGLREEDGRLAFHTSQLNLRDFKRSQHTIFVVSVPDFQVVSERKVEVIEVAHSEKWRDFLITDALYRTACFRPDGTKIWEHFQMHRTSPIEGVIYFADFHQDTARIGSIEVATGKETILLTEAVEPP